MRRLENEWQVAIRRMPSQREVSERIQIYGKGWSHQEKLTAASRWGWFVGQNADLLTAVSRAADCSPFDSDVRELAYYLESLEYAPKATATAA